MGIKRKKHESDSSERTGKDGNRALGSFTRNFIKNVTRTFFFFLFFFFQKTRLAWHIVVIRFIEYLTRKKMGLVSRRCEHCAIEWELFSLLFQTHMKNERIIYEYYISNSRKRRIEKVSKEEIAFSGKEILSIYTHLHVDPSFWYDEWSFVNNATFIERSHEYLISCLCGNKIR